MPTILTVEDDDAVRQAIRIALEHGGHRVLEAADGEAGIERWRQDRPDLILLDVMMPKLDGLDVCREIRRHDATTPIIMLTARDDEIDEVLALESGADDYVLKPFRNRALLARIKAILRTRTLADDTSPVVHLGDLTINGDARTVTGERGEIELTALEFDLLWTLASAPDRVLSRQQLLEAVWGYDYLGDSRLVDMCVGRVRRKLAPPDDHPGYIHTVKGHGYKASAP